MVYKCSSPTRSHYIRIILLTASLQSSSSVPVLILVLCCTASADDCNAIYDKAIQEIRKKNHTHCSISIQNRCEDAWKIYNGDDIREYQYTWIHSILDIICSDDCIRKCSYGNSLDQSERIEYMCLKHNNWYCDAIDMVRKHWCINTYHGSICPEGQKYCLDYFVNDFSCCLKKWESKNLEHTEINTSTIDVCGNHYNICCVDDHCVGDNCISTCTGANCHSTCIGADCNSTCVGDNCNSTCNGANCHSICVGDNCNSKCVGDNCNSTCVGTNCPDTCTDPTIDPTPDRMVSVPTAATMAVLVAIVAAALPLIVMAVIVFIRKISRKHLPATT